MKNIILFWMSLLIKIGIFSPIFVAKLRFFYILHRWPDFKNPRDINEKINYLKFYTDTSDWSVLADKYAVRFYLAKLGLDDILVRLYGKWDKVEDIDWDSLPNKFVLKCNNGSGDVVICHDKKHINIKGTISYLKKMLNRSFGIVSGEMHYAEMRPCIIAEELLDNTTQPCKSTSLIDYKIWCFDGKPTYTWCCANRHQYYAEVGVYDMNWEYHPEKSVFTKHYREAKQLVPRPACFDRMIEVASILTKGIPQVRLDLYEVNGKVYFGEYTFTSQGGYMDFYTQDFLNELGNLCSIELDN